MHASALSSVWVCESQHSNLPIMSTTRHKQTLIILQDLDLHDLLIYYLLWSFGKVPNPPSTIPKMVQGTFSILITLGLLYSALRPTPF